MPGAAAKRVLAFGTVVVGNSLGPSATLGVVPCARSALRGLQALASLVSARSVASEAMRHGLTEPSSAPSAAFASPTALSSSACSPQPASHASPCDLRLNHSPFSFFGSGVLPPYGCPRSRQRGPAPGEGSRPTWCSSSDTGGASFRRRRHQLGNASSTAVTAPCAATAVRASACRPLRPGPRGPRGLHSTLRCLSVSAPTSLHRSSSSSCRTSSNSSNSSSSSSINCSSCQAGAGSSCCCWSCCCCSQVPSRVAGGAGPPFRSGAVGAASPRPSSSGWDTGPSGAMAFSLGRADGSSRHDGRAYKLGTWSLSVCRTSRGPATQVGTSAATVSRAPSTVQGPVCALSAVRQLHASSGGSAAANDGGDGGSGGCRTAPPRRAIPREEGLGAPMDVFDRPLKALHRDRSATLLDSGDPLLAAVTDRLLDRLDDCRNRSFPTAVVLGGAAVPVLNQLVGGRVGIERVVVVDPSQAMLDRVKREEAESRRLPGAKPWPRLLCVRGDEEHLPLRPNSVDLIVSCLGLHWVNDLPGAMAQCRQALVPDGLFLAALFGGDTLQELRIACALAQMEREGGVSAVVSPLAQVRDAGNLLTRADLRLPTVDVDRFHIGYPSPLELVHHLRALGEGNASTQRRRMLSRDSALAAAAVYQSIFGNEDGSISATYEVIFMTGWAPSDLQPKASKRGSATVSFQDLAEGLVKGGTAVGGTADGEILTGLIPGAPASSPVPLPSPTSPSSSSS